VIVVAAGGAASSKLVQVRAVGGRVVEVEGSFSDAYRAAEELAAEPGSLIVNSTNPDRIEGQMTAAAEIVEQLGALPDVVTLPYGGGGNTKAYARGFLAAADGLPRLHPVESGSRADTVASAIRIVEPIHRAEVAAAIERSGGSVVTVSDAELLEAWELLRTLEGVFSEPASAAGIAGLGKGSARAGERVVCIVTGHGLKDPAAIDR
jgi:threonine synthase